MKSQNIRITLLLAFASLTLMATEAYAQASDSSSSNDSCQQAVVDTKAAVHQLPDVPAATTSITNAVDNGYRCITGNSTPVENDPAPASNPAATSDSESDH